MNENEVLNAPEAENKKTARKHNGLDLAAKIMSVIVAFVIWIYAVNTEGTVYEKTVSGVTVNIENIPSGFSIISGQGFTAEVKVKGKRSDVLSLTASDLKAYVDASSCIESGLCTLPISVNLPADVSLSDVYPSSISVYFGVTISKQLPITISLKNYTLETDYVIEKSTPETAFVTVTGPADELAKVSEARVTLEPGHITSSFTASGSLVLYDSNGSVYSNPYVSCSLSDVVVRIEVQTYKTIPLNVAYKYGYFNNNNVDITIEPSELRLKGAVEDLAKLERLTIATIDETDINGDTALISDVALPDNVISADGVSSIKITIKHKNTTTKTFAVSDIRFENLDEGKTCTLSSDTVNVTLRGDIGEYFSYFDENNITVVLDMKNYNNMTGSVKVPARIVINNESSQTMIYAVGSYSVSLTLE